MASKERPKDPAKDQAPSNKRKQPPTNASNGSKRSKPSQSKLNGITPKQQRFQDARDARTLATQMSSKAFKNGELDVDKFVKAREYEIRALEEGMQRSRKALSQRAFQQVPKELRRRTASHNVKRVPKRLQARAKREVCIAGCPWVCPGQN